MRSPSVPHFFPIHRRHFPLETSTPSLQKDGEGKATTRIYKSQIHDRNKELGVLSFGKIKLGEYIRKKGEKKSRDPVFSYRQEIQRSLTVQSSKLWVFGVISCQYLINIERREMKCWTLDVWQISLALLGKKVLLVIIGR